MSILCLLGSITAEVRPNDNHVAEMGRKRQGLAQGQGQSTVITAEVVVRAGGSKTFFSYQAVINIYRSSLAFFLLFALSPESARNGLRKNTGGVIAYLLVHLHLGVETQLWMRRRLWPEGKGKTP